MKKVDKLESHVALGDYNYIYTVTDPSIVGCYFKSILKYLEEPLCTYDKYEKFKSICVQMKEKSED